MNLSGSVSACCTTLRMSCLRLLRCFSARVGRAGGNSGYLCACACVNIEKKRIQHAADIIQGLVYKHVKHTPYIYMYIYLYHVQCTGSDYMCMHAISVCMCIYIDAYVDTDRIEKPL